MNFKFFASLLLLLSNLQEHNSKKKKQNKIAEAFHPFFLLKLLLSFYFGVFGWKKTTIVCWDITCINCVS